MVSLPQSTTVFLAILGICTVPAQGVITAYINKRPDAEAEAEFKKEYAAFRRDTNALLGEHTETLKVQAELHKQAKESTTDFRREYREDMAERRHNDANVRDCLVRIAENIHVEGPK